MSEALAKIEPQPPQFSREQVELIKKTVCPPDTTDDELKLFLHVARVSGLDPLRKQIHCTKRQGKLTLIAGIDGLRARAAREPDFEGLLHGVVCAKDQLEFDAATGAVTKHTHNPFADRGPIVGAWATVRRRGRIPFTAMVKFTEFAQKNSPTWAQMPAVMIDKVAQSTALRMAYPEQFSAIYEQAEMDQGEPQAPKTGAATEALKAKVLAAVGGSLEVAPAPEPEAVNDDGPPPPPVNCDMTTVHRLSPFERIRQLGDKYGKTGKALSSFVKGCCGPKSAETLTDADVAKVEDAFVALAGVVTTHGPPPDNVPLPTIPPITSGETPF